MTEGPANQGVPDDPEPLRDRLTRTEVEREDARSKLRDMTTQYQLLNRRLRKLGESMCKRCRKKLEVE